MTGNQFLIELILNAVNFFDISYIWRNSVHIFISIQPEIVQFLPFPSILHLVEPILYLPIYSKFLELLHFLSAIDTSTKPQVCNVYIVCFQVVDLSYLTDLRLHRRVIVLAMVDT